MREEVQENEIQEETRGREANATGKGKRNDPKRESARIGTRISASSPFSPFTYTLAAGNGIANPTTLHASWQLVISRPVLRQHTPRYVSSPPTLYLLSLSLSLSIFLFLAFCRRNCFTLASRRDALVLSLHTNHKDSN